MNTVETERMEELLSIDDGLSEEQRKAAEEIRSIMQETAEEFAADNDINYLLALDDDLQEELFLNTSMLNLLETARKKDDTDEEVLSEEELSDLNDRELTENAYLKLMNSCFKLAKVVNPMGGFGWDRMELGLGVQEEFEKNYWPMVTQIVPENAEAFGHLLGSHWYEYLMYGMVRGIGVFRTKGEERLPIGAAIYHPDVAPGTNTPVIVVDSVFVAEEFRSHGVGNLLMANIIRLTSGVENAALVVNVRPKPASEDADGTSEKDQAFELLQEFFDSWRFEFSMDFSRDFFISLADLKGNKVVDGSPKKKVISLREMGGMAPELLRDHLRRINEIPAAELMDAPFSLYDKDVSCGIIKGGRIHSIFLAHHHDNGDYRYIFMETDTRSHQKAFLDILAMLRFAYHRMVERSGEDAMFIGRIRSPEGWELIEKVAPESKVMIEYTGVLTAPTMTEEISSVEWEMLRKKAGYEPKLKGKAGMAEEDFSLSEESRVWEEMDALLAAGTEQ